MRILEKSISHLNPASEYAYVMLDYKEFQYLHAYKLYAYKNKKRTACD